MNEAVEIAKLRLFLKLVATVDVNPRKENYGLEPLPDIDFNIRAGNTLIGFATEKELLKTIQVDQHGQYRTGYEEELEQFKEDCELVSKAYGHFQNAQLINDQGSESFKAAKAELNKRLKELNHKLNVYLATNYGIDATLKPKDFERWLTTHQPFHWFAEFYQIVAGNGGFDCIIGNPPYVEYSKIKKQYQIQGYNTLEGGNLYCFVFERSATLLNRASKIGLIIPLSICSGLRMGKMRKWLKNAISPLYISNFEIFPSKLFDGAFVRTSIVLGGLQENVSRRFMTKLFRWYSVERPTLIDGLNYQELFQEEGVDLLRKTSDRYNEKIFATVSKKSAKSNIALFTVNQSAHFIYYQEATNYWMKAVCRIPYYKKNSRIETPDHGRIVNFQNNQTSRNAMLLLNSSLFYLWYSTFSDGFHLSDFLVKNFPVSKFLPDMFKVNSYNTLENSIKSNSVVGNRNTKKGDIIEIEEFKISKSKPIIDQIDTVLAQHYGFTEEELDFIINYDIKYRMGKVLNNGGDG